ncbi:DRTGG domain-containing protein [Solidesulfovibrio sp.]|uniref:DRTGG domain-containing protein n=1 Tax=Solidesulfovibrio sp. TaxID=2910990 RepID=UPI002B1EC824|nr:DRTGG domain-containing protein [Solidesulfovibrio sp.]MEA5089618.1 DRTGG domain-containing protein [Solidesulfovibrio sp.]HML54568.1 DRTGG domain-containing protein [Solidesulfovibrio magneticus]
MNGLYIGSTRPCAGKTLVALALGQRFQREGRRVGFMKPVDVTPAGPGGREGGRDGRFIRQGLSLGDPLSLITPVFLPRLDAGGARSCDLPEDRLPEIAEAYRRLSKAKDVMLVGGLGDFLHAGGGCGLAGPRVAKALGARVMLIDRYHRGFQVERLLAAREILGAGLVGVVLNDVPDEARDEAEGLVAPFLESRGLPVLGVIAHDSFLAGIRVNELVQGLGGHLVASVTGRKRLVCTILIGAMRVENFMPRFRRVKDVAVLCSGDRSDLQLLALEAGCAALVLTGDFFPSELVLTKAVEKDTPLLLLRQDMFAVAGAIEAVWGRARFQDRSRIAHAVRLVDRSLPPGAGNRDLGRGCSAA